MKSSRTSGRVWKDAHQTRWERRKEERIENWVAEEAIVCILLLPTHTQKFQCAEKKLN
jgi:hypothetical protein